MKDDHEMRKKRQEDDATLSQETKWYKWYPHNGWTCLKSGWKARTLFVWVELCRSVNDFQQKQQNAFPMDRIWLLRQHHESCTEKALFFFGSSQVEISHLSPPQSLIRKRWRREEMKCMEERRTFIDRYKEIILWGECDSWDVFWVLERKGKGRVAFVLFLS